MVTAKIFNLFKANTTETTKEVAWPKAAPPLLRWQPKADTFVLALNRLNILAVTTFCCSPLGLHNLATKMDSPREEDPVNFCERSPPAMPIYFTLLYFSIRSMHITFACIYEA